MNNKYDKDIIQHHFESIDSTQIQLKNDLESKQFASHHILYSTEAQFGGIGRNYSKWDSYSQGIAMSFTIKANQVLTLTSLEIGVLIINFLKQSYKKNVLLKWPNDIYSNDKSKLGGILIQNTGDVLIAGIGLNFGRKISDQEYQYSSHSLGKLTDTKKDFCHQLYHFILSNRLNPLEVRKQFQENCIHLNQIVTINTDTGLFIGIGESGEALIQKPDLKIEKIFSGSLRF